MALSSGRAVVGTGGADGMGAAMTCRFVDPGARVPLCDNRSGALAVMLARHPELGGTVCDVGDPVAVRRRFAEAREGMVVSTCW